MTLGYLLSLKNKSPCFSRIVHNSTACNDPFKECVDRLFPEIVATHVTTGNSYHETYTDAKISQRSRANYLKPNCSHQISRGALSMAFDSNPAYFCSRIIKEDKNAII